MSHEMSSESLAKALDACPARGTLVYASIARPPRCFCFNDILMSHVTNLGEAA